MPLPEFPISETKIDGFTNLMDMNKVLTDFELQKQSYQQGKVEKSTSLSEANTILKLIVFVNKIFYFWNNDISKFATTKRSIVADSFLQIISFFSIRDIFA